MNARSSSSVGIASCWERSQCRAPQALAQVETVLHAPIAQWAIEQASREGVAQQYHDHPLEWRGRRTSEFWCRAARHDRSKLDDVVNFARFVHGGAPALQLPGKQQAAMEVWAVELRKGAQVPAGTGVSPPHRRRDHEGPRQSRSHFRQPNRDRAGGESPTCARRIEPGGCRPWVSRLGARSGFSGSPPRPPARRRPGPARSPSRLGTRARPRERIPRSGRGLLTRGGELPTRGTATAVTMGCHSHT